MHIVKIFAFIFLFGSSLLMPNVAFSHADHDEPLSETQAMDRAIQYTGMIIDRPGTMSSVLLDKSWRTVSEAKIHKRSLRYIIVTLYNPSEDKTLYLQITTSGQLHGANFNGNFGAP